MFDDFDWGGEDFLPDDNYWDNGSTDDNYWDFNGGTSGADLNTGGVDYNWEEILGN